MLPNVTRRIFWFINRFFMVPMFRLGFGFFMGNPFSGYIAVLKTVGRKSGKARFSPVNYAILEGDVFCMAGAGTVADWYRNLRAHPQVEMILPAGAIAGSASTELDPEIQRVAYRKILHNGGFAGFFAGFNPYTVGDAEMMAKLSAVPLVRIHPGGLGSGAGDPGGWLWISGLVILAILIIALVV